MKKTLYLFQSGHLMRENDTLCFETAEKKRYIPVEDTKEIMVFGELELNKACLDFCSQKEIILHFFNYYSYYTGSFYPREHYNSGYMILRQAEYYGDEAKRLELAKLFVSGAVDNMLRVLKYYHSRGKSVEDTIQNMQGLAEKIADVTEIPVLMAYEGNIREMYYKSFDAILQSADFMFEGRTKRPPKNHLNALISFGNTILYTQVLSEIYQTHLDPRIGYLHTTNFRRFTLNLDVAEIFKPILVDRIIFSLIGRKQLTKNDFEKQGEGMFLKESGRRKFIEEWDRKMTSTIKHSKLKREVSYRRLLRLELYKLERHFMDEETYCPYQAKW